MHCPRCHQSISRQAIHCPHCGIALKAHGHPGITLHRATDTASLCATCTYDADDTCNFPQRPHAQACTLYHDVAQPLVPEEPLPLPIAAKLQRWLRRYGVWVVMVAIALLSVAIALLP